MKPPRFIARFFSLLVVIGMPSVAMAASAQQKPVLGLTELVRLEPEGILVSALLDTGASLTSLDARAIRIVERDGKPWVQFEFHSGNEEVKHLERPLLRTAKLRAAPGSVEQRPVVMMTVCLAGLRRDIQVNLVDRSKLRNPMLIGRNFLVGAKVVVDPSLKQTAPPICSMDKDREKS